MGIYVEIPIHAQLDDLWQYTQDPTLHERWDLRFSTITYLPRVSDAEPRRFQYVTRIGFGARIAGEGSSVGSRTGPDGTRTSNLQFWSDDPKSLIRKGSGYWQYIPGDQKIRFLTWYDYETRFGAPGRIFDKLIFRPLMGWATAWSFDRLHLWLERGLDPAQTRDRSVIHAICRIVLAFVFVYHGLVPKLLLRHPDEIAMLTSGGISMQLARLAVTAAGVAEIAWGILLLLRWRDRWPLVVTAAVMFLALAGVAVTAPRYLGAPFNPVTLNLLVAALATIDYLVNRDLPTARRCLRRRPSPPS